MRLELERKRKLRQRRSEESQVTKLVKRKQRSTALSPLLSREYARERARLELCNILVDVLVDIALQLPIQG